MKNRLEVGNLVQVQLELKGMCPPNQEELTTKKNLGLVINARHWKYRDEALILLKSGDVKWFDFGTIYQVNA